MAMNIMEQRGPSREEAAAQAAATIAVARQSVPANAQARKSFFKRVGDPSKSLRPPIWLVRRYLETNGVTTVIAPSGWAKSYLVISWGLSVATGTPWCGFETAQHAVFYVCAEGEQGVHRRLAAWQKETGVPLEGAQFYLCPKQLDLLNEDLVKEVAADIAGIMKEDNVVPGMVIIDTLAKNMRGNEDKTEDMGRFFEHCNELLRKTFGINVVIVHHTGHANANRGRGSSSLPGAIDQSFLVCSDNVDELTNQPADGIFNLVNLKMKDGPKPPPLQYRIYGVDVGVRDQYGENFPSGMLALVSGQGHAIGASSSPPSERMKLPEGIEGGAVQLLQQLNLKGGWRATADLRAACGCTEAVFKDALGELGKGKYVAPAQQKEVKGWRLTVAGRALLSGFTDEETGMVEADAGTIAKASRRDGHGL